MAKIKKIFSCQECGARYAKWQGQCATCQAWNTIQEETTIVVKEKPTLSLGHAIEAKPLRLEDIDTMSGTRIDTQDNELNRVLGGGLIPGSLILLSGEPGIGKSTLLLQLALSIKSLEVLYISGEESMGQIKLRAERIQNNAQLNGWLLSETSTEKIAQHLKQLKPGMVIVDSIQTLCSPVVESTQGSVSQIKQCTAELMKFAKETQTPVILVGHITKDGNIAGPKVLEHTVDTVLHFEGERHLSYRILRTIKNRFGSTSELGIYEMLHSGLREVSDPTELLISKKDKPHSGCSIAATLEGNRPLLIEIQALVTPSNYGTPQRSSIGFDAKRMNMLIAVLEKRLGAQMSKHDVFLNLAGGVKVIDPALDLGIAVSVVSSFKDLIVNPHFCFAAEIGLSGELRPVIRAEHRIAEAEKLGFKRIYLSKYIDQTLVKRHPKIDICLFGSLRDVLKDVFK